MKQLGWKKVHILNLFSKIAKWKPPAGELKAVDKENMAYINIKSLIIGSNITRIEKKAFEGCKNLKKITVETEKLNFVGKMQDQSAFL